jgi:acyl CoA:acetate/3-ketoacid CoA transferase alpha subunit
LNGEVEVHLIPCGNFVEKIRAGGAGIGAFYTPVGVGTLLEYGKLPTKYADKGTKVLSYTEPKEVREFNGRKYILEEAITSDYSFVKCWKADKDGNLVFRKTARNFNPEIATAGRICIAEADEIVEVG